LNAKRLAGNEFDGDDRPGNRWGTRMLKVLGAVALVGALLISTTLQAQDSTVQRGRTFAQANCARCHAIGPAGDSPLRKAPPFRTLHQRYPVENLVEALAEGIRTAHPAMPEFELDQHQIDDLIAYLKSLER
jgi:cytochrome c